MSTRVITQGMPILHLSSLLTVYPCLQAYHWELCLPSPNPTHITLELCVSMSQGIVDCKCI